MNAHLQETIDLLVNEVLGKFNLAYFKHLAASDVRPATKEDEIEMAYTGKSHPEIEYARSMLPELSKNKWGNDEGSSRVAFALSGGTALKIAKNQKGLAQNQAEVQVFKSNPDNIVTTKIYDHSSDFKWVIAEIVKPLSVQDFEQLLHIPSQAFVPIRDYLWKGGPQMVKKWVIGLKRMVTDGEMFTQDSVGNPIKTRQLLAAALQVTKNPEAMAFMQNIVTFAKKNALHKGEIVPDHFGRTADGRVVFYDFGGTEEVIDVHYR